MNDPQYIDARCAHLKEKQQQLRSSMWATVTRRQYLLKMKAKYAGKECSLALYQTNLHWAYILTSADGQKIAIKLSKGITKETCKAEQLLDEYNAACSQIEQSCPSLSLGEILAPTSDFWQFPCPKQVPGQVAFSAQRDIIEAYLLVKRCDEELVLLKHEMHNVIDYWNRKEECIKNLLQQLEKNMPNQFNRGCACLLRKLQLEVDLYSSRALLAFSNVIPLSEIPGCEHLALHVFHEDERATDDSDSSDEDSDSD